MSIQQISVEGGIPEKGTAIVTIAPVDDNKNAVSFAQLTNPQWQLMRIDGTIVNERSFTNSAMTSLQFVLSGDDLAIFGNADIGNRVISFQSAYDGKLDDGTSFIGSVIAEGTFNIFKVLGQADGIATS
jgi:hypothetical protein